MNIQTQSIKDAKYFVLTSMISITLMIISMLFAYRLIEFGPFLTPGGIFVFPATYFFADVVAEVYGYRCARQLIWGNLFCIILFNLIVFFLIKLPTPPHASYASAYAMVFGRSLSVMLGFCIAFTISDFINAAAITKWKVLLMGKFFWLRSIGSSIIGETIFSILATATLYFSTLPPALLFKQISSTWLIKVMFAILIAFPGSLLTAILKNIEKADAYDFKVNFNPFTSK